MLGLRRRRARRGAGIGLSAAAMAAIFAIKCLAALQLTLAGRPAPRLRTRSPAEESMSRSFLRCMHQAQSSSIASASIVGVGKGGPANGEDLSVGAGAFSGTRACGRNLRLELGIDGAACLLDALNHGLALVQLLTHVLDRLLQHEALGSALAFESGHQLGQSVEAFANGLSALLLCVRGSAICRPRHGTSRAERRSGVRRRRRRQWRG